MEGTSAPLSVVLMYRSLRPRTKTKLPTVLTPGTRLMAPAASLSPACLICWLEMKSMLAALFFLMFSMYTSRERSTLATTSAACSMTYVSMYKLKSRSTTSLPTVTVSVMGV